MYGGKSDIFTACLFDHVHYDYAPRGTCERRYGERKQRFPYVRVHFPRQGFFLFFFYECKALSLNPAGCSRDSLEQKERDDDDDDDDTSSLKNNISGLYCFYSPMGKDQSRPTLILLPNGISVA